MNGTLKFSPGGAMRENLPSRWTIPACACSTVKNEPKKTPSDQDHHNRAQYEKSYAAEVHV